MKCPFCGKESIIIKEVKNYDDSVLGFAVECETGDCFLHEGQGIEYQKDEIKELWNKYLDVKNICPVCGSEVIIKESEDYNESYIIGCNKENNCIMNINNPWFYQSKEELLHKFLK